MRACGSHTSRGLSGVRLSLDRRSARIHGERRHVSLFVDDHGNGRIHTLTNHGSHHNAYRNFGGHVDPHGTRRCICDGYERNYGHMGNWVRCHANEPTTLPGAVLRSMQDMMAEQHPNVRDFGAVGDGVADDTGAIRTAIKATPSGGVLYVTPGKYLVNEVTASEVFLIDHSFALRCAGWGDTQILVASTVPSTTDVFRLHVFGVLAGNVIEGCQIIPQSGTPARFGINLDATSVVNGDTTIKKFLITRNYIGPFGGAAIATKFPTQYDGIFNGDIIDNTLVNGIRGDRMGDTVHIERNMISGTAPGIYLNSVSGANANSILSNSITSCPPTILIDYALRPLIENNNLEPAGSCGSPTGKAVIEVSGAVSPVISPSIIHNSITGTPSEVQYGVHVDSAKWVQLDNMFTAGLGTQTGYRITSNSQYAKVTLHQNVGPNPLQGLTMLDSASPTTVIEDHSAGAWRFASPLWIYNDQIGGASGIQITLGDSQSGTYPLVVWKTTRGPVVFSGSGLNDLVAAGVVQVGSDATLCAEIDSVGANDTFKWSIDNCVTWSGTLVPIPAGSGLWYPPLTGLNVFWRASTGHTLGARWTVAVTAQLPKNILMAVGLDGAVTLGSGASLNGVSPSGV